MATEPRGSTANLFRPDNRWISSRRLINDCPARFPSAWDWKRKKQGAEICRSRRERGSYREKRKIPLTLTLSRRMGRGDLREWGFDTRVKCQTLSGESGGKKPQTVSAKSAQPLASVPMTVPPGFTLVVENPQALVGLGIFKLVSGILRTLTIRHTARHGRVRCRLNERFSPASFRGMKNLCRARSGSPAAKRRARQQSSNFPANTPGKGDGPARLGKRDGFIIARIPRHRCVSSESPLFLC